MSSANRMHGLMVGRTWYRVNTVACLKGMRAVSFCRTVPTGMFCVGLLATHNRDDTGHVYTQAG